ncbi:MAG: hypothetical protein RBS16_01595 [Candidatus Cloacimonadales bacterium]|jgi:hypothetical protein|nr:hypothetical protein [Candidatus Cloacimonadota bacterium]MDD2650680.1 hypothetical protein [Candidatus Cloacimonadota bacterium]MDX9976705.1 hypothetical protein [Candidatus Cloacimonadales bacterium]
MLKVVSGKIKWTIITMLFKKEFLEKNNILFTKGLSVGEDTEFGYFSFALTNKVNYVNEYLVYSYRGHSKSQLSSFSLDKIENNYLVLKRFLKDDRININKRIENKIVNYGLHTSIILKLITAINRNHDKDEILYYYNKYSEMLHKYTFNNGLRSLKLNYNRYKLLRTIKMWKQSAK